MATKWVDPTSGSDANSGDSKVAAYKTFSVASAAAGVDGEIIVADGTHTYAANVTETILASNGQTVRSESGDRTACILSGSETYTGQFTSTGSDLRIEDITWDGFALADYSELIRLASVSDITIVRSAFNSTGVGGNRSVIAPDGTHDVPIVVIDRCLFDGFRGGATDNRTIVGPKKNNSASGNDWTVLNCVAVLRSGQTAPTGIFGGAMEGSGAGGTYVVRNCILLNESGVTLRAIIDSASNPLDTQSIHNCIYASGGGSISIDASVTEVGTVSADPMFVDPAGDNWHLQPGSPCLNAGSLT